LRGGKGLLFLWSLAGELRGSTLAVGQARHGTEAGIFMPQAAISNYRFHGDHDKALCEVENEMQFAQPLQA
jgi:hypothetical protein